MQTLDDRKLAPQDNPHRTAFISGHIDIAQDEFLRHYQTALDTAISSNDRFIMSNANGADSLALQYLLINKVDPARITVFLHTPAAGLKGQETDAAQERTVRSYRSKGLDVKIIGDSHTSRDRAMTGQSDYDILWVRSEEATKALYGAKYRTGRISGTQKNRDRREAQNCGS